MRILIIFTVCCILASLANLAPYANLVSNITTGITDSIRDSFEAANASGAFSHNKSRNHNVTVDDVADAIVAILDGIEGLTIGVAGDIDEISRIFPKNTTKTR